MKWVKTHFSNMEVVGLCLYFFGLGAIVWSFTLTFLYKEVFALLMCSGLFICLYWHGKGNIKKNETKEESV